MELPLCPCASAGWGLSAAHNFACRQVCIGSVGSFPCRSLQQSRGSNTAAMHAALPVPSAGQAHPLDRAARPLHPLLHPPAIAPARPVISMILADKLFPALPSCPSRWKVIRAPHPHLCPCPHPLPPPGAPEPLSPNKLSSCLTSNEPRSSHSQQRLGPPSCSSVCLPPSAGSCPTSQPAVPCERGLPFPHPSILPVWDGDLAQRSLQGFGNNTEAGGSLVPRKTLQDTQFGRTQGFTKRLWAINPGQPLSHSASLGGLRLHIPAFPISLYLTKLAAAHPARL